MNDDFKNLKAQINLAEEITKRTGMAFKSVGKSLDLVECPFCGGHDCFRVNPDEQSFKCFQCPDAAGDVFDFVQRFEKCDKKEALRLLASEQGYMLADNQSASSGRTPEEEKALEGRSLIFEAAAGYYHAALFATQRAIGYQRKVRRHADETLKAFRVGYADGRLIEHLTGKGFNQEEIVKAGLAKIRDGRLADFFIAGLYIYPHQDRAGRIAGFTCKDPDKKYSYRLAGEHWGPDCPFLNMAAFAGNEVFLVEGENDLLAVRGRGGFSQVAATCGQISKEQLDYLAGWAHGKTVYLCFDNDQGGQGYTRKVCHSLEKLCLTDTLAKLFKNKETTVKIISFDDDIKDIDEYLKKQPAPEMALKLLIDGARKHLPPLKRLKNLYHEWINRQEGLKFDFDKFGQISFEWLQAQGKFFIDGEVCNLYFRNQIYQIGNNTPFKALLYELSAINAATTGARLIIQNIESQAYLKGDHTSVPGWIFTNFHENTIYFNLCDERNNLLKIGPGKIEMVPNGTNAEKVLLRNSPRMQPLRFIRDIDVRRGMASLKAHIFDNLACDLADRYFVICLLFNVVLLQNVKARGITKFSGTKGSGKTAGASMLSTIIYGEDCVTTGSAASDFSEAAVSPLTISDNLESDAVQGGKRDFLLTAATGITRQKRKSGSDSGNVYERSCTQLLVTSIEPFAEPELIERTNEIIFDKAFHNPAFKEAVAVETELRGIRDTLWSTLFKVIAERILPGIEQKKAEALKTIREAYPNHSKARLNELYAMLFLILGEVVTFIPHPEYAKDSFKNNLQDLAILDDWIKAQNSRSFDTEADTNKILYRLEALLKEHMDRPDWFEKQYGLKAKTFYELEEPREIVITASTGELFKAFDFLAKDRGITNTFNNSSQLGARIGDSLEVLKRAGWEFKRNATAMRGERKHTFTKKFPLER